VQLLYKHRDRVDELGIGELEYSNLKNRPSDKRSCKVLLDMIIMIMLLDIANRVDELVINVIKS
jgi:hypothetical protein